MTVGELQAELAKAGPEQDVMVLFNGCLAATAEVIAVAGAHFVMIRTRGNAPPSKRFTINEEGLIGHLSGLGLTNEKIGEVLGRPAKSIAQKRKTLGF